MLNGEMLLHPQSKGEIERKELRTPNIEDSQVKFLVCRGILGLARTNSSLGFEGVKIHKIALFSNSIRDKNIKI